MNQIHDILGSIIIGGIVLLMLTAFNGNVMESAGIQIYKTTVQGNLTTVTDILEYDFRKMGYRVSPTQDSAITFADTSKITFKGDFNDDGVIDSLQYYIDTVRAFLTPNPNDKVLRRKLNTQSPQAMFVGATRFKVQYYSINDTLIKTTPVITTSKIKAVKITLIIQSTDRIFDTRKGQRISNPFNDTTYAGVYWERKVKPVNMR